MALLGKNFLFIHVYKTGGTSLTSILQSRGLSKKFMSDHCTAAQAKEKLGDAWSKLFSFGFCRNPYSWCVSLYRYIQRAGRHFDHRNVAGRTFAEFLPSLCGSILGKDTNLVGGYYTLTQALCDASGEPLVNYVGSFENYRDDVQEILRQVGLSPRALPILNYNYYDKDLSHYYGGAPDAVDLVRSTFAQDFEVFGYSTEPPL